MTHCSLSTFFYLINELQSYLMMNTNYKSTWQWTRTAKLPDDLKMLVTDSVDLYRQKTHIRVLAWTTCHVDINGGSHGHVGLTIDRIVVDMSNRLISNTVLAVQTSIVRLGPVVVTLHWIPCYKSDVDRRPLNYCYNSPSRRRSLHTECLSRPTIVVARALNYCSVAPYWISCYNSLSSTLLNVLL